MIKMVGEKDSEMRRKEEAKEKRKQTKEKKRDESVLESNDNDNDNDNDTDGDDSLCNHCRRQDPPNVTEEEVNWVDCDKCSLWFHSVCVGLEDEQSHYVCHKCSPSHTE